MAFQNDFLDFNDFSRLAYDKVFLNSDFFEDTLIYFGYWGSLHSLFFDLVVKNWLTL